MINTNRKKIVAYLLILITLFYTVSCKYFKYDTLSGEDIVSINNIDKIHKYFIVHANENRYSLLGPSVDSTYLSGNIQAADSSIYYFEGRKYRMRKNERKILQEVHVYLIDDIKELSFGPNNFLFSEIREIRIMEKNGAKTTASYVFGTFGIFMGVLVIISAIAALTKSSCPYVYSHDGEGFIFEGEIFGGAIAQNLQREDFLPLPSLKAQNDMYRIRISNELKERQFTDLAQMVVVEHSIDQKVLLDNKGTPYSIANTIPSFEANSFSGENLQKILKKRDDEVFFFNETDHSENGVVMKFDKPENIHRGKLIIKAKNTLWFDYQFGEFLGLFGEFYDEYMDRQSLIPGEERQQVAIDNNIPLSVYCKKNGEWELVDLLFTIGPLASRDFVLPIDLRDAESQYVEIMLATGFMFWEIDYAAMDFSEMKEYDISYLNPIKALGSGSIDWTDELSTLDSIYMAQEEVGEVTEIVYHAMAPKPNNTQTCFLHTSGYYELIRDFEGLPKLTELNKFKEDGYFSDFSRKNYLNVLNKEQELASVTSY